MTDTFTSSRSRYRDGLLFLLLLPLTYSCRGTSAPSGCASITPGVAGPSSQASDLEQASAKFKATEALQGKRGPNFEQLALLFSKQSRGKSDRDVIHYLGDPTLVSPDRTVFVYPYSRFGENDWVFLVGFERDAVSVTGFNERSASIVETRHDLRPYAAQPR